MAKEDFCFTYYDGDAARDKAHMSRLERGAYDDIISAQRKKGHLSIDDIKKVLSKDFAACWPALEWVLPKDAEGKYYIEWVDKSLEKMRRQSKRQKEKIDAYWDKKRQEGDGNNGASVDIPQNNHGIEPEQPLGDGIGTVSINSFEGVETFLIPSMLQDFKEQNDKYFDSKDTDFPALLDIADKIKKMDIIRGLITVPANQEKIKTRWGELVKHIAADPHYCRYSLSQINKHFQSITQSFFKNGTHKQPIKQGKNAGNEELADRLKQKLKSFAAGADDA